MHTGPQLFARYAYPPNELGYCGGEDHRELLEYGAAGVTDPGLGQLARGFSGAWPYLTLIAEATGIGDPLDRRVVEAYWIGNRLLDRVDLGRFGRSLEDRFRARSGPAFDRIAQTVGVGGVPHHSFHVFCVYPWTGLLAEQERSAEPLRILDRCRVRWGRVVSVEPDHLVVRTRLLQWDGKELSLGAPQIETATRALDGVGFVTDVGPGDWVALHWDWVCDRLTDGQVRALRRYSAQTLEMTNRRLARPGPHMVLSGG